MRMLEERMVGCRSALVLPVQDGLWIQGRANLAGWEGHRRIPID